MNEKAPKSPILVVATILFLSIFIILPPLFRAYFPEEEKVVEVKVVKSTLYCERVAPSEMKKITSKIYYENDVAVKNILTFMDYTPSDAELAATAETPGQTVEQEITYLKSLTGVDVQENSIQTIIELNQQTITDNATDTTISNYLSKTEDSLNYFESIGFSCSELEE